MLLLMCSNSNISVYLPFCLSISISTMIYITVNIYLTIGETLSTFSTY